MTNAHASALRRMIGALVMTGFGAWWVFAGMGSVGGLAVWIYLAVAIIPAALAASAILRLYRVPKLPGNRSAAAKKMSRNFRIVFIEEILLIVIAVLVLGQSAHPDLITVAIALIVGLHFLPLAAIFKAPLYYPTGVVMIAWTITCWILLPSLYRAISIAIGCGLVLWITSLVLLVTHRTRPQ